MNRRWVCNDVWMNIFPLFDRPQLGLKLALLSPRFNALVDKHFDAKSELTLWRETRIEKGDGPEAKLSVRIDGKFVGFPLPDRPMHNKIRFKKLQIEYIDHSVITFLRDNHQIFDKGIKLDLHLPYSRNDENVQLICTVFANDIWPIFAPNIRHLNFCDGLDLEDLRRNTSPSILSDLNQLDSINSSDLLPDLIADDGPEATAGQALSKWLNTPRKDGRPKQLSCQDLSQPPNVKWINDVKEAFLHATTTTSSASYIIRLELFKPAGNAPFELINERTNEKLTLEKEENDDGKMEDEDSSEEEKDDENVKIDDDEDTSEEEEDTSEEEDDENMENEDDAFIGDDWLLKRCPIGETIQWEDENWNNLNNVNFSFYNGPNTNCIGKLSPPKAGQKNAENLNMKPGPSGQRKKK